MHEKEIVKDMLNEQTLDEWLQSSQRGKGKKKGEIDWRLTMEGLPSPYISPHNVFRGDVIGGKNPVERYKEKKFKEVYSDDDVNLFTASLLYQLDNQYDPSGEDRSGSFENINKYQYNRAKRYISGKLLQYYTVGDEPLKYESFVKKLLKDSSEERNRDLRDFNK